MKSFKEYIAEAAARDCHFKKGDMVQVLKSKRIGFVTGCSQTGSMVWVDNDLFKPEELKKL